MNQILDDNFPNPDDKKRLALFHRIEELENKDWYGIVLICFVIGLIIISTAIKTVVSGFSIPLFSINILIIGIHVLLLFLARTDKVLSYIGGLITFILFVVLNILLSKVFFLKQLFWVILIIGSYSIFIYEAIKLKRLRKELETIQ